LESAKEKEARKGEAKKLKRLNPLRRVTWTLVRQQASVKVDAFRKENLDLIEIPGGT